MNAPIDASLVPDFYAAIAKRMELNHALEALLYAPTRYTDCREVFTDFRRIQARGVSPVPVVYQASIKADPRTGGPSIRGYGRRGAPPPKIGYADPQRLLLKKAFCPEAFRLEIDMVDAMGNSMVQSVFGSVWGWKDVQAGEVLTLCAQVDKFAGNYTFSNPTAVDSRDIGTVAPVYTGLPGKNVNGGEIHALMGWINETDERLIFALEAAARRVRKDCGDLSEQDIIDFAYDTIKIDRQDRPGSLVELIAQLHRPATPEQGEQAHEAVRRICVLSMQCIAQKVNTRPEVDNAPIGEGPGAVTRQANQLIHEVEKVMAQKGYGLTKNQKDVVRSICDRMGDKRPLKGLLNGEVGAGKTIAYGIPAVAAHLCGARVAVLAPTDLLANQIAKNLATEFGASVAVERVRAGRKIRNPDAILVGTIGINTAAKKIGWEPDVLIYDEQHKIHTAAREELVSPHTHTLEVSATPIPRSLGLSLYGGMDIFTLNEQPVVKDIQTGLLDAKDRSVATAAIRTALRNNQRVAIVYTLVDRPEQNFDPLTGKKIESDVSQRAAKEIDDHSRGSAIAAYQLFEQHFPGQVTLLHGKMSQDEKVDALDRFRSGQCNLIVTTTIFETGIDVPDVRVVIVRDPEHLGLSQLHQLRGRAARSGGHGLCLLLTEDLEKLTDETYARLNAFCQTNDGYRLATQDMLSRGLGDLDGLQQDGRVSTVFKNVKMSTRDLLALEPGQRAQLYVQAEIHPSTSSDVPAQELSSSRPMAQQRLFA